MKVTNRWRDETINTRSTNNGVSSVAVDPFNYPQATAPSIPTAGIAIPSIPMAGISIP